MNNSTINRSIAYRFLNMCCINYYRSHDVQPRELGRIKIGNSKRLSAENVFPPLLSEVLFGEYNYWTDKFKDEYIIP
jgi:hypothetical protein